MYEEQIEAPDAFDAVWALALALNNVSESLCNENLGSCGRTNDSYNVPLEEYRFFNDRIECLMNRSLNATDFQGVSVSRRE